jgi:hypothetical protein
VSRFDGNFGYLEQRQWFHLLRDLDSARRVVDGWADYESFTADELSNLDNVRLACSRLAESIEAFISTHDELDPDNQ